MKVLVTGGAGFVGSNLVHRLIGLGHEVTSIDNYHTGRRENHHKKCMYIEADIGDFQVDKEGGKFLCKQKVG